MVNETNRQRRPPRREFRENSRQRNYRRRNMNNRNESLKPPSDINLPFFAYGIFKPGQLAYSKIEQYVEKYEKSQIDHIMLIRDGVPIITKEIDNYSKTNGYIIYFKEEDKEKAYKTISNTKSSALYEWDTIDLDNTQVNVLFGVNPILGSSVPEYDDGNFNGKNDPFFKEAIELIEENLKSISSDHLDVKEFFELQMNYMLLWSAIDRYTSLKYNEESKGKNNRKFANEKAFQEGLKKYVNPKSRRKVYSADGIKMYKLDAENPEGSLKYYYTIRCNVVHRGKAIIHDKSMLKSSLEELLNIFKDVLNDTFEE